MTWRTRSSCWSCSNPIWGHQSCWELSLLTVFLVWSHWCSQGPITPVFSRQPFIECISITIIKVRTLVWSEGTLQSRGRINPWEVTWLSSFADTKRPYVEHWAREWNWMNHEGGRRTLSYKRGRDTCDGVVFCSYVDVDASACVRDGPSFCRPEMGHDCNLDVWPIIWWSV